MALQQLRSSTANKRPTAGAMSDGQLAVNTNATNPGLFFKDADGSVRKVGPVFIGSAAPNASPASGGSTGHSVGEQWLDNSGGTYVLKIWDGTAWRSESGTFVDVSGDTMTGVLQFVSGSASAPGIAFSGDTNTGIYRPGADSVAVTTGGSERLRIDSSGVVTTKGTAVLASPLTDRGLKVSSTAGPASGTGGAVVTLDAQANTYDGAIKFAVNGSEHLRIDSSGNVGINSTDPLAQLHIVNPSGTAGFYISRANGSAMGDQPSLRFIADSTKSRIYGYGDGMTFWTAATSATASERMRIDSSGNVGIGTSSPAYKLHVEGSINAYNGFLRIAGTSSPSGNDPHLYRPASGSMGFWTGGGERMRIDSSGNVHVDGIFGTDTKALRLNEGGGLTVRNDDAGTYLAQAFQGGNSPSNRTIQLFMNGDATFAGDVGIGTTSASSKLHVYDGASGGTPSSNAKITVEDNGNAYLNLLVPSAYNCGVYFGDNNNNDVGYINYAHGTDSLAFGVNASERMRIDSSGRLLVGTTSSSQVISALFEGNSAGANSYGALRLVKGSTTPADEDALGIVVFGDQSHSTAAQIVGRRDGGAWTSGVSQPSCIDFATTGNGTSNTTTRMRIDSSGNVGIGTTSPVRNLQLGDNTEDHEIVSLQTSTTGKGSIYFGDNTATAAEYAGMIRYDHSDNAMSFRTTSQERMRIRSDGKVLIGTTDSQDSSSLLQIYKSSGTSTVWNESDSLSNGQYSMFRAVGEASGTSNSRQAWIGVHNHSGITNACGFIFMDAQNSNNNYYWTDDSSNLRRTGTASNIGTTNGTVVGTQTSDERLKNVGDNVSYGLTEVLQLQPKQYALKSEPDVNKLGFIAQEVESIIPEAVFDTKEELEGHQEGDRTKLGMEYVQLIPVLVNAIKEQQTTIADLQSRLAALEAG